MTQSSPRLLRLSVTAPQAGSGCAMRAEAGNGRAPGGSMQPAVRMRVGDLAKLTGVTVRTLHHYEELGLIEPVARSKGQYRLYGQEAESRIRWIGKLKDLGLSLSEVQDLVRRRRNSPSAHDAADELHQTYRDKLLDIRERLNRLSSLEQELEESLRYLEQCGSECTPSHTPSDCVHCERRNQTGTNQAGTNDLINGALL